MCTESQDIPISFGCIDTKVSDREVPSLHIHTGLNLLCSFTYQYRDSTCFEHYYVYHHAVCRCVQITDYFSAKVLKAEAGVLEIFVL